MIWQLLCHFFHTPSGTIKEGIKKVQPKRVKLFLQLQVSFWWDDFMFDLFAIYKYKSLHRRQQGIIKSRFNIARVRLVCHANVKGRIWYGAYTSQIRIYARVCNPKKGRACFFSFSFRLDAISSDVWLCPLLKMLLLAPSKRHTVVLTKCDELVGRLIIKDDHKRQPF